MASSLSRVLALGLFAALVPPAWSTGLSGSLTGSEVDTAAENLSLGSIHRAWTAPAIPNDELGLTVGVESTFLFRRGLLEQGDETAVVPRIIPVPRLWAMWDLPRDFQVSTSFAPGGLFDGITAFGLGGQWSFWRNADLGVISSVATNYTYANAFGDLQSHTFDVAAQVARDLDIWQPYAGAGFLFSEIQADPALLRADVARGYNGMMAFHFYFGARVDLMAHLSFQVDFMDTNVALSALMSASF